MAALEDKLSLSNNAESSPLNPEFSGDGSFSSIFSNATNESNKVLDNGAKLKKKKFLSSERAAYNIIPSFTS